MSMNKSWQELARARKQTQQSSIPEDWKIKIRPPDGANVTLIPATCGLLTARELEITDELDVDVLLRKLATREWTSLEVTQAYLKRAILAHQLTNCLTNIFINPAIAWAKHLDEYLATTGKVVGPLHGLPISLKDQFCIAGHETIMGYVSWIGKSADKNSVLTQMLLDAGAVLFVRTNVPQTLMWGETYNHVFGRTLNPYNTSLTAGGSSGGEGALVGMRGSPLGVGTDIGGSVRIPAGFCGIFGLRPSYNRLPYQGALNANAGQDSIPSVLGPMSNTLSGLKTFTKALLDARPWDKDPFVLRKPWDQRAYELEEHGKGKRLCFGILMHDKHTVPHPPILRALKIIRTAIERAGHRVVEWEPYKHSELYDVQVSIETADGGASILYDCAPSGEPWITSMDPKAHHAPLKQDETLPPESRTSSDLLAKPLSVFELWKVHETKRKLRKDYLDYWRNSSGKTGTGRPIDALISPIAPFAPPPHGHNTNANYTMIWNTLDYPAIAFPVTFVNQDKDVKEHRDKFWTIEDEENYRAYDPQKYKDAPVGLQLVASTQEEEALLRMMEIVQGALDKLYGISPNGG